MASDVLVLLDRPANENTAQRVSDAIYGATATAVVSWNAERGRVFLVRFDPLLDTPAAILQAARSTGVSAHLAGG